MKTIKHNIWSTLKAVLQWKLQVSTLKKLNQKKSNPNPVKGNK